jgi:hypothetical protein
VVVVGGLVGTLSVLEDFRLCLVALEVVAHVLDRGEQPLAVEIRLRFRESAGHFDFVGHALTSLLQHDREDFELFTFVLPLDVQTVVAADTVLSVAHHGWLVVGLFDRCVAARVLKKGGEVLGVVHFHVGKVVEGLHG